MIQTNIFEMLYEPFKIKNKIRLIELFAGIGSQAKALERIGADFEHYKVVEFDKYAMKSYNAVHGTTFETSDITKIHAHDLEIKDTHKFTYLLTYSFPCQDLSKAGKGKGMEKGSGTRSGLLWEVERILDECDELPQVLLMENVPDVIGTKNIEHFLLWKRKLEQLGYQSYVEVLNAKDYGIPQNRERCFMISILGSYYYEFPQPFPLKLRLKDMLEDEVDEKFYLGNEKIEKIQNSNFRQEKAIIQNGDICGTLLARDYKDQKCVEVEIPKIDVALNLYELGISGFNRDTGDVLNTNGICKTIQTMQGGNRQPKILQLGRGFNKGGVKELSPSITTSSFQENNYVIGSTQKNAAINYDGICPTLTSSMGTGGGHVPMHNYDLKIRKLTPLECWRLMGFDDEDFHKAELVNSNSQLYKQVGNSIVVNVLEEIFKQLF